MKRQKMHQAYCFAGQPAACPGFFRKDVLPCVCGAGRSVLIALSEIAMPAVPIVVESPDLPLLALSA